ncbi:unnamed protein product, partial [marine sediment metagenome]
MSSEKKSLGEQNIETRERLMKAAAKIEEKETVQHERILFEDVCH